MKKSSFKLSALALLCLPAAMLTTSVIASDGPPTRFIIKYKDATDAVTPNTLPAAVSDKVRSERMSQKAQRWSAYAGEELQFVRDTTQAKHSVFRTDRKLSADETRRMLKLLAQDDDIEAVEEDVMLRHYAVPNDPQYTAQWHYYESAGGLRLPAAWDTATGQGVTVAVLDTGYRPHADLNANILPGYDMISDTFVSNDGNGRDNDARDPGDWMNAGECGGGYPPSFQGSSWHGTHVAGTIAAITNNNAGVAGVAYNAKILPVRVLGKCGGYTSDIADGIIWASGGNVSGIPTNPNPAQVINMSLGGSGSCSSVTQNAINIARNNGSVIVIAAGNDNGNANNFNPGNCSGVVNVAATNRSGGRAYYSNTGSSVDVAAPGGAMNSANDPNGVLSTYNTGTTTPGNDSYGYSQGTSMAAPHVAGVAALIKQVKPSASPDEVEQILKSTARSFPATCNGCGTGIVDAAAAVQAAANGNTGGPGGNSSTTPNLSATSGNWLHYTLNIPAGTSSLNVSISGGSGDADLYVRRGSQPTTSQYDCRPYQTGNNESCSFSNPQAGTWHISLRAYSTFSGVTLQTSYQ